MVELLVTVLKTWTVYCLLPSKHTNNSIRRKRFLVRVQAGPLNENTPFLSWLPLSKEECSTIQAPTGRQEIKKLLLKSENISRSIQLVIKRIEMISGLTYIEDFIPPDEQEKLVQYIEQQPWSTELKRRVQHYGYRYDYKSKSVTADFYLGSLPEIFQNIANQLVVSGLVSETPDQVIVNEYMPGQGIALHVDCVPCFGAEIASISLLSVYPMRLRSFDRSLEEQEIFLGLGSCLILKGDARYCWSHGIRSRASDNGIKRGRRISLTFRKVSDAIPQTEN